LTLQNCIFIMSRQWSIIRSGHDLDPADCSKSQYKHRD